LFSASTYYFNSDKNREGYAEVRLAIKFAHFYHLGSIALGSLIIAILRILDLLIVTLLKRAHYDDEA
jgi:hypothetical protein